MMADVGLIQTIAAGVSGALGVKILDILHQELTRKGTESKSAKKLVDAHLSPLLKSADELTGKLLSLAESDFKQFDEVDFSQLERNLDFLGLAFLFGCFWANIELLRRDGLTVDMAQDPRGDKLQKFFDCLESRRLRILDRFSQRAIGEIFVADGQVITFVEFVEAFDQDEKMKRWLTPLLKFISRMTHTRERQNLLQYGIIIHALIDTLDHKHMVSRERPSWPNKLTKKSWRALKYRVFGVYLTFVSKPAKYLGPPKKATPKVGG